MRDHGRVTDYILAQGGDPFWGGLLIGIAISVLVIGIVAEATL